MTDQNNPSTPGYYARRGVTSEVEQQMRADYAHAVALLGEGLRSENRGDLRRSFDTANELHARWRDHDDFEVRTDWQYLNDAADDWRRSPGAMEQMYEQILIDRVDGWTEPMSEREWRSQRQAREIAGRGQWREARDPFSIEAGRSRPASAADPANPKHYADSASTWAEQVMRADFALATRLRQERDDTYTDSEYLRLTEQIHDLGEQWSTRDDALGREWRDMRTLAAESYYSPSEYADAVEQIEQYRPETLGRDSIFTRSVDQVARLKGIDHPYLSRSASHSPQPVASSAFASARTAELRQCGRAPIPGHAFAGLVNGHEREGVER
ncbi:hypothetical protein [Nocardia grenadensis]